MASIKDTANRIFKNEFLSNEELPTKFMDINRRDYYKILEYAEKAEKRRKMQEIFRERFFDELEIFLEEQKKFDEDFEENDIPRDKILEFKKKASEKTFQETYYFEQEVQTNTEENESKTIKITKNVLEPTAYETNTNTDVSAQENVQYQGTGQMSSIGLENDVQRFISFAKNKEINPAYFEIDETTNINAFKNNLTTQLNTMKLVDLVAMADNLRKKNRELENQIEQKKAEVLELIEQQRELNNELSGEVRKFDSFAESIINEVSKEQQENADLVDGIIAEVDETPALPSPENNEEDAQEQQTPALEDNSNSTEEIKYQDIADEEKVEVINDLADRLDESINNFGEAIDKLETAVSNVDVSERSNQAKENLENQIADLEQENYYHELMDKQESSNVRRM